jgi:predicted amidohydrolase
LQVNLGICQFQVVADKATNLERATQFINRVAGAGAQIIALPEMFNCPYRQKSFAQYAETAPDGETLTLLAKLARTNGCYLIGGSIPEREQGKLYNTSFVFDRNGTIVARYRKVHLFDIAIPGKITCQESAVFSAGDAITYFDTEYGRFGVAICYDLRFPELFRLLVDMSVRAVFVPAAFNTTTGPAHWRTLLRSRAIDNQVFIAGIGPARNPAANYAAYGHSAVVDPWGTVLWEAEAEEALNVVPLDLDKVAAVRQELPLLAHRRSDLYCIKWFR